MTGWRLWCCGCNSSHAEEATQWKFVFALRVQDPALAYRTTTPLPDTPQHCVNTCTCGLHALARRASSSHILISLLPTDRGNSSSWEESATEENRVRISHSRPCSLPSNRTLTASLSHLAREFKRECE